MTPDRVLRLRSGLVGYTTDWDLHPNPEGNDLEFTLFFELVNDLSGGDLGIIGVDDEDFAAD